jgi:hypothetical protein
MLVALKECFTVVMKLYFLFTAHKKMRNKINMVLSLIEFIMYQLILMLFKAGY